MNNDFVNPFASRGALRRPDATERLPPRTLEVLKLLPNSVVVDYKPWAAHRYPGQCIAVHRSIGLASWALKGPRGLLPLRGRMPSGGSWWTRLAEVSSIGRGSRAGADANSLRGYLLLPHNSPEGAPANRTLSHGESLGVEEGERFHEHWLNECIRGNTYYVVSYHIVPYDTPGTECLGTVCLGTVCLGTVRLGAVCPNECVCRNTYSAISYHTISYCIIDDLSPLNCPSGHASQSALSQRRVEWGACWRLVQGYP